MTTTLAQAPVTFRRDRFGECWHLIPAAELGPRSRALCGQPRQGTPLSETYAEIQPAPTECMCQPCTEALDRITELLGTTRLVVAPRVEPVHPEAGIHQIPPAAAHWLPAVSTSKAALDDPQGWYQRTLAAGTAALGVNVSQLAVGNLSPEERHETQEFTRHTLDRGVGRVRPFALPADSYSWTPPTWSVLVKADQRVVTHAGIIYRVIQVGQLRLPVGGIGGVMTLHDWRRHGYARVALAHATAFVGMQLWAPFAVVICPRKDTGFYEHIGWHVAEALIWCEQPCGRVTLEEEVAAYLPCQGDAEWPSGPIDLGGTPW
jgi:aminoglycoside 2'-N-acetyltransferase I